MLTKKAKNLYESLVEELGSSQIDLLNDLIKEIQFPHESAPSKNFDDLEYNLVVSNFINGNLKDFRRQLDSMDSKELADFVVYCQEFYPQLDSKEIAHQLNLINN